MAIKTLDSATESTPSKMTFEAGSETRIQLPSEGFVTDATMTRDGDDLVLQAPNGEVAVVKDYYSVEETPLLQSPNGTTLTPELVNSFSTSSMQYAANDTATDESPVGAAEEVKGGATVTRADGSIEPITIGTPIYQGDVIQTEADGAVNIRFMDETSMAVSQNARMSIDNYSFDAKTESGETDFSVLRGVFVFTSGLIGRDDPDDVHITTPVGSIGIRGTIIAGDINPAGESSITVLEGAIVVTNSQSETTLSKQFETVHLTGFDTPMQEMGVVPAADINARFESVSYVVPTLFSTIEDSVQEQSDTDETTEAPVETKSEEEPSEQEAQPQDEPVQTDPEAPQAEQPLLQEENRSDILDPSLPTSDVLNLNDMGLRIATGDNSATAASTSSGTSSARTNAAASSLTVAAHHDDIGTNLPPTLTRTAETPSTNAGIVTPPALTFTMASLNISSVAGNGTGLGTLSSNASNEADVTYTFTNGGMESANGHFRLVTTAGITSVILLTDGADALAASLDPVLLDSLDIVATHADGRTVQITLTPITTDDNVALNLNVPHPDVTVITDSNPNNIGYSIAALGDMNNDGFDDFAFTGNRAGLNEFYIIKGGAGYIADGSVADLHTAGRLLKQQHTTDTLLGSQTVIAGIGDYNGDGQKDYVLGQGNATFNGMGSGAASIVNGSNRLGDDVTFFNTGASPNTRFGESVAGVGDYNNDGYADVVIGSPGYSGQTGRGMLVFGTNNFNTDPSLVSGGAGTELLTISGASTNSNVGYSVAGAGDLNGDGYSDFVMGAPGYNGNQGYVKIFYGGGAGTGNIAGMETGLKLGEFVTGLGDINGDGFSDMLIGTAKDKAKIALGGNTLTYREIDLEDFSGDYSITGGGAAGDFNGDGYDDMTISLSDGTNTKIYVVYGSGSFSGFDSLNYLKNSYNAFEMSYTGAGAADLEISKVGDLNGDGYDDIAISVPDANGASAGNGGVFIVNGRDAMDRSSQILTATDAERSIVGTSGHDTMSTGTASDVSMRGGAGDDIFEVNGNGFRKIDGGTQSPVGYDTIRFTPANGMLDFSAMKFEDIQGIEILQYGGVNQTMILKVENLFDMLKSSDKGFLKIDSAFAGSLVIDAPGTVTGANDQLKLENALNQRGAGADYIADTGGYHHFEIGGYDLYVDNQLAVTFT